MKTMNDIRMMSEQEFEVFLISDEFESVYRHLDYAIQFGEFGRDMSLRQERMIKRYTELHPPRSQAKYIDEVMAGCGHMVERSLLMNASLGTSCPECYDRLSD